ncbi:MAG TPA: hypothetical protein VN238_21435 [Solirubrobacteraceae bacterium]|nr:hypothetical protein [Solirubrobacteraceae bacterium]
MLAAIVDTGALLQVVWVSFAAAIGLTLVFTGGVLLSTGEGESVSPVRRSAGIALLTVCAAMVALGLYVMFALK